MIKCVRINNLEDLALTEDPQNRLVRGIRGCEMGYEQLGPADAVRAEMLEQYPCRVITSNDYDLFDLAGEHGGDGDHHTRRDEALARFHDILHLLEARPGRRDMLVLITAGDHRHHLVRAYETAFNQLYAAVKELLEHAAEHSITLALENPGGGILLSPLELRELIDVYNSPFVRIAYNPHHAARLGDAIDWLRLLNARAIAVRRTMTEVMGDFDVQAVSDYFQTIQPQGFLIDAWK